MTTNLAFGFFDWTGTSATAGLGGDVFHGSRRLMEESSSTVTSSYYQINLAAAEAPEFCAITNANIMNLREGAGTPNLKLIGSTTSGFGASTTYTIAMSTANLSGANGEDLLFYNIGASAFQYWRIQIETTTSLYHKWGKVYAGTSFDFGRDPVYPEDINRLREASRMKRGTYSFTLRFEDITLAKKIEFNDSIMQWAEVKPVMLFTRLSYDPTIDSRVLIHAMITKAQWKIKAWGRFDLSLELREVL